MSKSRRATRLEVATTLRSEGLTWVEIAEEIRARWPELGARAAIRIAHGWTQKVAAWEWTARWPNRPKESRDLSLWELWPSPTGRRPSLDSLDKLAQLYACSVSDLLVDIGDYRQLDPGPSDASTAPDLSGVWRSSYRYPTGDDIREGDHVVVLRQHGEHLTAQSLPHSEQSQLSLDLMFRAPTATGTWVERTSPAGRYKGAYYHGSIQLMVDPSGRAMTGKWVGFGRKFDVNSGDWQLTWIDGNTTEEALQEYHLRG